MYKKVMCIVLALLLISGCAPTPETKTLTEHSITYFDYFDTIVQIKAYTESEEDFQALTEMLQEELSLWHKLMDNFRSYEAINNVYSLNAAAGGEWITLDKRLMDLLEFSIEAYERTNGQVNIALGEVTKLWHEKRTEALQNENLEGELPDEDALTLAGSHADLSSLELDHENSRARITDPHMSIDLGAVSKGYVNLYLLEILETMEYNHILLNLGGNLSAVGKKGDGSLWKLGINNPFRKEDKHAEQLLKVASVEDRSIVSSGNYERYYHVEGVSYHHIIDPDTLFPNPDYAQITLITPNPAWGDVLSTALYNMTIEEGQDLLSTFENTEALWVLTNKEEVKSVGWGKHYLVEEY